MKYECIQWNWLSFPESEFNEFEPRLRSSKNRFQLSAGLNFETLNTILEPTIFDPRLKFFKFGLRLFIWRVWLVRRMFTSSSPATAESVMNIRYNYVKLHMTLKSYTFSIRTHLIKDLLRRRKLCWILDM